ncbi:MAG: hypothetical protein ABFC62_07855 [Clostridiaceae bacterium]|nr:hypothetical protein [Eubacteriales bacterium]
MKQFLTKKHAWKLIFGTILFLSLLFSVARMAVRLAEVPIYTEAGGQGQVKADYMLGLVQCALGLVVMFVPSFLAKRFSLSIPNYMYVLYYIFLYCAVYLGEVRRFYFLIPDWDTYLHTFSGAMLGAMGFSIASMMNDEKSIPVRLSPGFLALFAFCFALASGAVWEIYEYTVDAVLKLNMQKYMTESGSILSGRAALADTMEDMIVDAAGALVMSVAGYLSIKLRKRNAEP